MGFALFGVARVSFFLDIFDWAGMMRGRGRGRGGSYPRGGPPDERAKDKTMRSIFGEFSLLYR